MNVVEDDVLWSCSMRRNLFCVSPDRLCKDEFLTCVAALVDCTEAKMIRGFSKLGQFVPKAGILTGSFRRRYSDTGKLFHAARRSNLQLAKKKPVREDSRIVAVTSVGATGSSDSEGNELFSSFTYFCCLSYHCSSPCFCLVPTLFILYSHMLIILWRFLLFFSSGDAEPSLATELKEILKATDRLERSSSEILKSIDRQERAMDRQERSSSEMRKAIDRLERNGSGYVEDRVRDSAANLFGSRTMSTFLAKCPYDLVVLSNPHDYSHEDIVTGEIELAHFAREHFVAFVHAFYEHLC